MFYAPMVTIKMTYIVRNHIGLLFSYFLIASYSVERSTKMFHLIFLPFSSLFTKRQLSTKKCAKNQNESEEKKEAKEGPI